VIDKHKSKNQVEGLKAEKKSTTKLNAQYLENDND
jgi:hypothetical protein